jgi:hypothetical protein
MFIILSWLDFPDITIVLSDDGKARLFETQADAGRFAFSELAMNWKIIEL